MDIKSPNTSAYCYKNRWLPLRPTVLQHTQLDKNLCINYSPVFFNKPPQIDLDQYTFLHLPLITAIRGEIDIDKNLVGRFQKVDKA
jgi:hypothetical protein